MSSSLYCGLSPCVVLMYCRLSSKPKTKGMLQLICFYISTSISIIMYCIFQLLSHVQLFVTQWTAEHQASLSFNISWSFLKFMSNESVMLSNYLILCCPLLLQSFPASGSFVMSWLLESGEASSASLTTLKPLTGSQQTMEILKEMGIPDYLACFLRNLYEGQKATVRTWHGTMDWFRCTAET